MANDNRAEIVLDGDVSPFRKSLREAGNSLRLFGAEAEGSISRATGPLAMLQSKFVAIGALLAGGAVFKEAVAQAATFTEESIKLGRALDISAGAASILREALTAGNTSQEEFIGAAKGLAKQLLNNESGLQAMGLATRDAAGNLRPLTDLVFEGIDVMNGYRAGTDRAIAGQELFGKGFAMTSNLAEMNKKSVADVAQQMRELGVVTNEETVAAYKAFDDAGDKSALTMSALQNTIGNALMPVLTQLNVWFSDGGPTSVQVMRGVMEMFVEAIYGVLNVLKALGTLAGEVFGAISNSIGMAFGSNSMSGMELFINMTKVVRVAIASLSSGFAQMVEGVRGALTALNYVLVGKLGKADQALQESAARLQKIRADYGKTADEIVMGKSADGTPTAKPGTGGKGADGLLKPPAKPEKSHMAEYEAQLAAKKNLYEQENLLRQYGKEQELAYWRELQQAHNLSSNDRLAIAKRTATLELDIRRQNAKEQRDLDAAMVDSRRAAALAQIQLEEQQANFARENGAITQRELIAQQEEFARRRFEIEYQSQMQRLEMAQLDPNSSPAALMQIKEQMLEIERQYLLRRGELQQQAVVESTAIWRSFTDTITGLWDKGIAALMNGTFTWSNAFRAAGAQMVSWFATEVVGKQVKDWIAGQAKMLAVKMGFMAAEKAAQTISSGAIAGEKGKEAIAVVAANAAEAGSGAAAAVAPTPGIGPLLALAAMATVFGAVMALGGRQKSAAKGYDIPKGLNPMVQTHEEEMILPQKYANVIRGMAAGGEGGQGGGSTTTNHYHISTFDSKSFERFAHENKRIFAGAVKSAGRDGFK